MSLRNFKIPLEGLDAVLSMTEINHGRVKGEKLDYVTYEMALMGTNDWKEFSFIGEPIQLYDLHELYDVMHSVIKDKDWAIFLNQYEVELELEPQLELVVDNDNTEN
jgi:hypothetical protein